VGEGGKGRGPVKGEGEEEVWEGHGLQMGVYRRGSEQKGERGGTLRFKVGAGGVKNRWGGIGGRKKKSRTYTDSVHIASAWPKERRRGRPGENAYSSVSVKFFLSTRVTLNKQEELGKFPPEKGVKGADVFDSLS